MEWLHEYVSSDPSVNPAGSPFPKAAPSRAVPLIPLETVIEAAFMAAPWSNAPTRRRLAAQLAAHQGWTDISLIAQSLRVTAQSVRSSLRAEASSLSAAALVLGDERLLDATSPFERRRRPA